MFKVFLVDAVDCEREEDTDGGPATNKSGTQCVDEGRDDDIEKTLSNENLDSHVLNTPLSIKDRDSK